MQLTFAEAYHQYEDYIDVKLKVQSKRALKNKFKNHILPYFKDYNIYELKEIDYLNWQLFIENKGYSYKYNTDLHLCMTGILNYFIKYHGLKTNIASNVGNFKNKNIKKHVYNIYTLKEFKRFIKCVDNNVYKQFFNLMFYCGTRPGEAMALTFNDLHNNCISINKTIDERYDEEHKKRTINSPKTTSSYRDISIDNKLKKDLLKLKKYYQSVYDNYSDDFFIFGGSKPLAPTTINRYKLKACDKAKVKPIKLHEFRHSHATLLLNNNVSISTISKRLGHNNTSITLNTYIHSDLEQEKKVSKILFLLRLF